MESLPGPLNHKNDSRIIEQIVLQKLDPFQMDFRFQNFGLIASSNSKSKANKKNDLFVIVIYSKIRANNEQWTWGVVCTLLKKKQRFRN